MSFFWCCCQPGAGGGQCDLCESTELPELFVEITGVPDTGVCGCDDINDTWVLTQVDNCEWYGEFPGDFCSAVTLSITVTFSDAGGGAVTVTVLIGLTGDWAVFCGDENDFQVSTYQKTIAAFACELTNEQMDYVSIADNGCGTVCGITGGLGAEVFVSTP